MKNYAETKGKEAFDWNKFLENPPEKGSPEHLDACDLAEAWVTCACGNLCDIIPRSPLGCPIDEKLEMFGGIFNMDIIAGEWQEAKKTIHWIERRSDEIIFELTK
jgi:hypothetical protein